MPSFQFGILLIFGIAVFGGIVSALVIKRMSIPQVLGYIALGLLIGRSGLRLVTQADIVALRPFSFFALGVIGFLVGSEIRLDTFRKYGRQFLYILLGEGLAAFFLVGALSWIIVFMVSGNFSAALAAGIVFGAIASATDPASTINVLWEYRAAGVLTTTLVAVVALDDALAMGLYGLGTGVAQILAGGAASLGPQMMSVAFEVFGSVALGVAGGLALNAILRRSAGKEYALSFALGILLLCIGTAVQFDMDVILAAMAMGITVTNVAPRRFKEVSGLLKSLSIPIYVLFFVLVGARLAVTSMPGWLWLLASLYVIGRCGGKMIGAYAGARLSNAEQAVRRFTGMGLMAQGGVAVGLSIMAGQRLHGVALTPAISLGETIIFTVTATTFAVQIMGPPLVKLAIKWAGESGKNITEEDVLAMWRVRDVARTDAVHTVTEQAPLSEVFALFSHSEYNFIPVVDTSGRAKGIIRIDEMKDVILDQSCWTWMVASDVMVDVTDHVCSDVALSDALNTMSQLGIDQIAVFDNESDCRPMGVVDLRDVRRRIRRYLVGLHAPSAGPSGPSAHGAETLPSPALSVEHGPEPSSLNPEKRE